MEAVGGSPERIAVTRSSSRRGWESAAYICLLRGNYTVIYQSNQADSAATQF